MSKENNYLNRINSCSYYWESKELKERPDDLDRFARTGINMRKFGCKEQPFNPLLAYPVFEGVGGVIYFGNDIKKDEFEALARILQLPKERAFAAVISTAQNPRESGYLTQLRTITRFGLSYYFGALDKKEYEEFPPQESTVTELYWNFIEEQKETWGTMPFGNNRLSGKFSGDGYWTWENLSFGIMIENSNYGISRIWSRAYLLTR